MCKNVLIHASKLLRNYMVSVSPLNNFACPPFSGSGAAA
jgi:hypothetical protein